MESTLFTELTFTEQENLSGGRNKIVQKQSNKNKTKQVAVSFFGGPATNTNGTLQANVAFANLVDASF